MPSETNEQRIQRLIEEFAVQMEVFGLPNLAGRLFSALLFAEPPEKSTQELIRLTGGSKGAISQMLRLLGHVGPIEKCASPNKRGYHYRLRRHFMVHMHEQNIHGIRGIHEFLNSRKEDFAQLSEQSRENIQEMMDFQFFFLRVAQEAFEKWKEQKSSRTDSGKKHPE